MCYTILNITGYSSDSVDVAEIGIIGGADGPTSIFITASVNWPLIIGIGSIILMSIGFIAWKKKHRK